MDVNACVWTSFYSLTTYRVISQDKFGVRSIRGSEHELMAVLYLQVSIVSQALIFVTRSRSWSFVERPGILLVTAFLLAQLVSSGQLLNTLKFIFVYT
jgi:hypothetical protein